MLKFLKFIGRPLLRLLFSVEYHGLQHVPQEGAVILASNHPSYLDPILVAVQVDRTIRFMAWDALFKVPVLGWLIRRLGAFPVDIRKGRGEAAFREAQNVLEDGHALVIFPEGQRSEQGPMGELRTGVARLASATGAPIIPITIGGAVRAWPKWKLLPKPAKIVVRYQSPIYLSEAERAGRESDREFHKAVMQRVAESINRSLHPALHEAERMEKWYAQPPSHIRTYEWAPLMAAIIGSSILWGRGSLVVHVWEVWLTPLLYYLYVIGDLLWVPQQRLAKWVRNSMPVWLMIIWHSWLTRALGLPTGRGNLVLIIMVLVAFFPFFYENYFSVQKFVRGLVVSYYFSLLLLLQWPHELGALTTTLCFIALFHLRNRILYYQATVSLTVIAIVTVLAVTQATELRLLAYAALAVATNFYLQTFVSVAYDIRREGDVSLA